MVKMTNNLTNGGKVEKDLMFTLYHMETCPYCIKVRSVIDELDLDIELRDTIKNPDYRSELVAGGGSSQVPCLKITNTNNQEKWLYESNDIIDYLMQYNQSVKKAC